MTSAARSAARLSTISRHLSTSPSALTPPPINRVTVFGAGLMGAGIAQVSAQAGLSVMLCDLTPQALTNGRSIILKSLERIAKKREGDSERWVEDVMTRIASTSDAGEAVSQADLVVEAIVENMKVKQQLFSRLDGLAPEACVFASNTSSLPISEIASSVSDKRRANFAGLHFFNPVPAMKLVEIVSTSETSAGVTQALFDLCHKLGKTPVGCKDTPGFIVNRLLVPYMLEAIRMVERGEASPQDIDTAMKLGAGYPMGPFELLDYVGLDTTSFIASGWRERADPSLPKDLVAKIPMLEKLVAEGKLGRKSGAVGGFYSYDDKGRKK